jgi:hypothetical protein
MMIVVTRVMMMIVVTRVMMMIVVTRVMMMIVVVMVMMMIVVVMVMMMIVVVMVMVVEWDYSSPPEQSPSPPARVHPSADAGASFSQAREAPTARKGESRSPLCIARACETLTYL